MKAVQKPRPWVGQELLPGLNLVLGKPVQCLCQFSDSLRGMTCVVHRLWIKWMRLILALVLFIYHKILGQCWCLMYRGVLLSSDGDTYWQVLQFLSCLFKYLHSEPLILEVKWFWRRIQLEFKPKAEDSACCDWWKILQISWDSKDEKAKKEHLEI